MGGRSHVGQRPQLRPKTCSLRASVYLRLWRKRKAITYLHEEEIERLFAVINSIRDRAIFRLAYHAGLRTSEVGMLEMRDYDPKTHRIFVYRLTTLVPRDDLIVAMTEKGYPC